jgi:AraC-like DNA-binding protein
MIKIQKIQAKSPVLQKLLDCFLFSEVEKGLVAETIPNARVDAWINLSGSFSVFTQSKAMFEEVAEAGFFRLSNQKQLFKTEGGCCTINLKFYPHILFFPLFQPLMNAREIVDWKEIFSNDKIKDLLVELKSQKSLESQIQIIEDFLLKEIFTQVTESELVELIKEWENMLTFSQSIQKTATDAQISIKTLERKFKKYVGINPKELHKLMRLQTTMQQMQAQSATQTTNFSENLGLIYYDQSHFIKECKSITGLSPKHLFKKLIPQVTDVIIS